MISGHTYVKDKETYNAALNDKLFFKMTTKEGGKILKMQMCSKKPGESLECTDSTTVTE